MPSQSWTTCGHEMINNFIPTRLAVKWEWYNNKMGLTLHSDACRWLTRKIARHLSSSSFFCCPHSFSFFFFFILYHPFLLSFLATKREESFGHSPFARCFCRGVHNNSPIRWYCAFRLYLALIWPSFSLIVIIIIIIVVVSIWWILIFFVIVVIVIIIIIILIYVDILCIILVIIFIFVGNLHKININLFSCFLLNQTLSDFVLILWNFIKMIKL